QEIVSVRSRTSDTQRFTTSGDAVFPTVPLAVLTDEGTASASEIVAGALQDHDRALVVGSTSFGKGLVQTLFPLDGGYALKLTTAEQTLSKAFAPKQQDVYVTLADYALELSHGAKKDFKVQPQWRDEFYRRLVAKGVVLDRAQYTAAGRYVDRLLEQRVARLVAGDSTAKRRDMAFDAPLRKAVEVMEKGQSQRDLFTIAAATHLSDTNAKNP